MGRVTLDGDQPSWLVISSYKYVTTSVLTPEPKAKVEERYYGKSYGISKIVLEVKFHSGRIEEMPVRKALMLVEYSETQLRKLLRRGDTVRGEGCDIRLLRKNPDKCQSGDNHAGQGAGPP